MKTILTIEHETSLTNRAKTVLRELVSLQSKTKETFFTTCALLLEAYENGYHVEFGYSKFGEWIEQCDLDMSGRTAYYLLTIAERSRALGMSSDELAKLSVSKLKEIFGLKPEQFADEMKQLVSSAEDMTVEEVKEKVKALKAKSGEEIYTHVNLKLPMSVKEVLDEAFELVRRLNGSVVDERSGDIIELSDAKCLEYMAASFLQDPNNHPQDEGVQSMHYEVIEDSAEVVSV